MKRILAIIMLAITAQAADIVVYPTPATGASCGIPKTGQTATIFPGDDGGFQKGVERPVPLYTIMDNTNCVLDNSTGLIWARDSNVASTTEFATNGQVTWTNAFLAVSNLNATSYGGRTDWRVPNRNEMASLIIYRVATHMIADTTGTNQWTLARGPWTSLRVDALARYWTSTSYPSPTTAAFYISIIDGGMQSAIKTTATYFVWPCAGP